MNKKGDISWEVMAKLLIGLVVLLVLIILSWLLKDQIYSIFDSFKNFLRFN